MPRIKYKEAIGLEVKRGRPPAGPAPSKADLVKLYVKEERSVRDVAAALGCSKDMVARALKAYRIKARTNVKRSGLREYSLAELESGVKRSGIRGLARELGIDESTLRHHLNVRKAD
jgi:hypothetical protein